MAVRVGMLKSGMTAEDHRLSSQVHALGTGQALQTHSGLVPGSNPTYTKVAGMTARVSAFQGWIDGTSQFVQGGYPFTNDADADVTFADGDATRDRIDLVVARVYDQIYDASGNQVGRVEVVKGDYPVSGPAVAPAAPPSSIVLWEQPIPAGATAGSGGINVANAARGWVYTAAAGGIVPVRNQAERDALAAYDGLVVARLDTGNLERRHQGQWGAPSDIAAITGEWQSYAPTWQASTNPNLGNGSLVGRYKQIGKTVHFHVVLTVGSTTSLGTGTWNISLPVSCRGSGQAVGSGYASQPNRVLGWRATASTSTNIYEASTGTPMSGSSTLPATAQLVLSGTYEAA